MLVLNAANTEKSTSAKLSVQLVKCFPDVGVVECKGEVEMTEKGAFGVVVIHFSSLGTRIASWHRNTKQLNSKP